MSHAGQRKMSSPEYAKTIAKKRSATIAIKRAEKMKGMSDVEKTNFLKKCYAMDRDYKRKVKLLAALRKVLPGATLKDIAVARKEGWLPSVE